MKSWEKALNYKWGSGAAHTFFLYLDVADNILQKTSRENVEFETLADHLISSAVPSRAAFTAFFNLGQGIRFPSDEMEAKFVKFLKTLHPETATNVAGHSYNIAEQRFYAKRHEVGYALELFDEMLKISWKDVREDKRKKLREALQECFGDEAAKKIKTGEPFFAVVFEHLRTITPPNCSTGSCKDDRAALVTILTWANGSSARAIREARNIVILVEESLDLVDAALRSETNGIVPLKLHFPDLEDIEVTYGELRRVYTPHADDLEAGRFAQLATGMSRNKIISLVKEMNFKGRAVSPELLFEHKKKFISEQSGNLLQIMQPLWGLQAIGGLLEHKKYILEVIKAMKDKDLMAVPMGILLLGCPGVGKTVFAQALAYESGLPFLTLGTFKDPYVGMSLRNLTFALELAIAQSPVVFFVDEIEQKFLSRDTMRDNTGVNNEVMGRLLEIISDTDLRGKILWIGASNKPYLLDTAMLDRFEKKIPFPPLDAKGRGEILSAILYKKAVQAKAARTVFEYQVSDAFYEEFGWLAHRHFRNDEGFVKCDPTDSLSHPRAMKEEMDDEVALTGRQIEKIIGDAYSMARSENSVLTEAHLYRALDMFLPPPDMADYNRMTEIALLQCDSERFIPEGKWRKVAARVRASQMVRNVRS
ncbi:MAG: ATP-binding protein [Parcubacteria group bacterium]|nr:ATP-binding protein [Parcubacteria group bacterium]